MCTAGELGLQMWTLVRGVVALLPPQVYEDTSYDALRKVPALHRYEDHGAFAAAALLQPRVHKCSAWAETTCDLWVLEADAFRQTMQYAQQGQMPHRPVAT